MGFSPMCPLGIARSFKVTDGALDTLPSEPDRTALPWGGSRVCRPLAHLMWGTLFRRKVQSCHETLGAGVGTEPCKGEGGSLNFVSSAVHLFLLPLLFSRQR